MGQAIVWSGGKPYEYVDGVLTAVQTPQVNTMPDGTKYTYNGDGVAQALPAGQTTVAPSYAGTGIGVPQWLVDQNPGKTIDSGNALPLGGNTTYSVGDQVYSGTQWNGEGSAPWTGGTPPGYFNYENTPALKAADASGKLSQLNGTPYNSLDANGNVTGHGFWSGITDSNKQLTDSIVIALVGAALGGIGAYGGAAGAAGAGSGAAGSGAGFVGEGAASGIGAWDGALAGAGGGAVGAGGAGAASGGYGGGYGGGFVGEGAASGVPAWDGALSNAGAGAGAGAGVTSNTTGSGFVGEGTTSGVPAWDNALARVGTGTAMGAPGASGGSGGTTGTTAGTGSTASSLQNVLNGTASEADWLKLALGATSMIGGAAAGSQGQQSSSTATKSLDPRMDSLLYDALAPITMGTLGATMPEARTAGNQMLSVGAGLLGQTAPTTATNPYLKGVADDMSRRTSDLLGQNNLAIQGGFVGTGGLGGTRQGVAQGVAAGKASDYLQGNVANLYGTAYAGDQNRLLQQQTLGAGLLSQGIDTQFQPLKNTTGIFSPFANTGGSVTGSTQSGGGTTGMLGGAITGAAFGHQMGWW